MRWNISGLLRRLLHHFLPKRKVLERMRWNISGLLRRLLHHFLPKRTVLERMQWNISGLLRRLHTGIPLPGRIAEPIAVSSGIFLQLAVQQHQSMPCWRVLWSTVDRTEEVPGRDLLRAAFDRAHALHVRVPLPGGRSSTADVRFAILLP